MSTPMSEERLADLEKQSSTSDSHTLFNPHTVRELVAEVRRLREERDDYRIMWERRLGRGEPDERLSLERERDEALAVLRDWEEAMAMHYGPASSLLAPARFIECADRARTLLGKDAK